MFVANQAPSYPNDLKYSKEHEWVKVEGGKTRIGITYFAQDELGDVVFVELPEVGDEIEAGRPFSVVESVKAVSDIYAPVSGRITEVNQALADRPELINQSPYGDAWIVVVEPADPAQLDQLMSSQEYVELIQSK